MIEETQSQQSNISSQFESQPLESVVWGRLYAKNIKIKSMDLNKDEISIGRGDNNDIVLTVEHYSESILGRISKVHFQLKRANCDVLNPVYIEDLSRNGTFVNGEKIGRKKSRILQSNDIISLAHHSYKAFVFKDLSPSDSIIYPIEIKSKYYISRKLGSGACGQVDLVYDRRTCKQYAMKHVKKNMLTENIKSNTLTDPQRIMNEAKIMNEVQHPCIIQMHEIVDTSNSVYMILEYMKGGDLLGRIMKNERLPEKISKIFFFQMCHAVKYLHDRGITHRDIKPDNILLESNDEMTLLKVSDFGLSKFVQNDSIMRTLCGTPLYVAPEILITQGRGSYTNKVDIWSLGVVLFTCLSGTLPFCDEFGRPSCDHIKKGKFRFGHPSWKNVSQRAKALILQMLIVDPNKRPNIDDVLKNSWFKDIDMIRKAKTLMNMEIIEPLNDEENFLEPPSKRTRR